MVLCTLINISLDISTNIAWWLTKNTLYGTYYLITIIRPPKPTKEEIELMELKNELGKLNKQLHIIYNIHNNPHIINRNQLMLMNSSNNILNDTLDGISDNTIDDNFDLSLLDEFVILNDNDKNQIYKL